MKKYIPFILLCITALMNLSCEKDIPLKEKDNKPCIQLSGWLKSDTASNLLILSLASKGDTWKPAESRLTVSVNGGAKRELKKVTIAKETPSINDNYENYVQQLYKYGSYLYNAENKFDIYEMDIELHANDKIHLEASAENGKYHAEADVTMPSQQLESMSADYENTDYSYLLADIRMKQRPDDICFYKLNITQTILKENFLYQMGKRAETHNEFSYENDVDFDKDVALNDGNMNKKDNDDIGFFDTIENKEMVFSSQYFKNGQYEMKSIRARKPDLYSGIVFIQVNHQEKTEEEVKQMMREQAGNTYSYGYQKFTYTICTEIFSISKESYTFLKKINALQSSDYDDVMMEPVMPGSNVKGGIGYVGGMTVKKDVRKQILYRFI